MHDAAKPEAPAAIPTGATQLASPPSRPDRSAIERQIRARYAAELSAADICESLQIEIRIRAEIESALAAAGKTGPQIGEHRRDGDVA